MYSKRKIRKLLGLIVCVYLTRDLICMSSIINWRWDLGLLIKQCSPKRLIAIFLHKGIFLYSSTKTLVESCWPCWNWWTYFLNMRHGWAPCRHRHYAAVHHRPQCRILRFFEVWSLLFLKSCMLINYTSLFFRSSFLWKFANELKK